MAWITLKLIASVLVVPLLAGIAYYALNNMRALEAARTANKAAGLFLGKNAVVVGGTSGIGHGIALRLAEAGFSVTIVGRNAQQGQAIVGEMDQLSKQIVGGGAGGGSEDGKSSSSSSSSAAAAAAAAAAPSSTSTSTSTSTSSAPRHAFMPCDATLLANAYRFGRDYAQSHSSLEVLVLTQGIGSFDGRTETTEGLDKKLALHYYSRVAFVDALLPLLRNTTASPARVLTVLTAGVHSPYAAYATDPELKTSYSLKNVADAACFYNDMAVDALSRVPENNNILFVHAAPGFVNTNWGSDMPWYLRGLVRLIQPLGRTLKDCGEFMSTALLQPRQAGFALMGQNGEPVKKTSLHDQALEFMWKHTKEVLGRVNNGTASQ